MKHIKEFITHSWDCNNLDDKHDDKQSGNMCEHRGDNGTADMDSDVTLCGVGSWRPQWLQVLARPTVFLFNFSLIGLIQGMTGSYLIASMSTLERRFAFDSTIAGYIMIADNIVQMMVSPIVGYLGSRFNRPRMIATGELVVALSCFVNAMPYFIYGAGTHLLHDDNLLSKLARNETRYEMCPANGADFNTGSCDKHRTVWPAVVLLLVGSSLRGLGFTAYFVIGMPYMDDSVSKRSSAIYLSLISALKLVGPASGYVLTSITLRYYEDPFYNPGISRMDPRFIGAWWLGFVLIGIMLFFVSLPMFLFPKQLKSASVKARDLKDNVKGLEGTIAAVKRLARNPILMFHLIATALRYIGNGGYHIFKSKYLESHFHQTSAGAGLLTGTTTVPAMAVGIMLGGIAITWFKPRPRWLIIYMVLVEFLSCGGKLGAMFIKCPSLNIGNYGASNSEFTMNAGCNQGCDCTTRVFTPICAADGVTTYFSPCYAGCHYLDRPNKTLSECACIGSGDHGVGGAATTGYCKNDVGSCNKILPYLSILTLGSVIASTARTGTYLIILRSVDPKDKSFAMGMMSTFMAVFAFIPYPLIFGAIVNSACLVWKYTCGKRGNCWLYDPDKFRYYLHGTAFGFMFTGALVDLVVIFLANRIKNFYDEPTIDEVDKGGHPRGADDNNIHMTTIIYNNGNVIVNDYDCNNNEPASNCVNKY